MTTALLDVARSRRPGWRHVLEAELDLLDHGLLAAAGVLDEQAARRGAVDRPAEPGGQAISPGWSAYPTDITQYSRSPCPPGSGSVTPARTVPCGITDDRVIRLKFATPAASSASSNAASRVRPVPVASPHRDVEPGCPGSWLFSQGHLRPVVRVITFTSWSDAVNSTVLRA